jgi:hypothetical protein
MSMYSTIAIVGSFLTNPQNKKEETTKEINTNTKKERERNEWI